MPGSETKEVVVIELSEPVLETGKTESLSSSPIIKKNKKKLMKKLIKVDVFCLNEHFTIKFLISQLFQKLS